MSWLCFMDIFLKSFLNMLTLKNLVVFVASLIFKIFLDKLRRIQCLYDYSHNKRSSSVPQAFRKKLIQGKNKLPP